jgi:pimeloyl-ACP methyl ester carboxylesterase
VRLLALGLVLMGLVALVGPAAAASASPAPLTLSPCPVPGGTEIVRCGRLEVPEDWRHPHGRTISLNVVVLPQTGPGPAQAPAFWLEGGPGVPATQTAALYSTDLRFHRERRALVFVDQRGTGGSGPLHCPGLESGGLLADPWPPAQVIVCRRGLAPVADVADYTTREAVEDLDAVRRALGYCRIDLMALSYGTILAQAYMKTHPEAVRAAALIGTVPLGEKLPLHHAVNGEAALRMVFRDCDEDAACHQAFPTLESDWSGLIGRLDGAPEPVVTGEGTVLLRAGPFGEAIRNSLTTPYGARDLPLVISRASRGDFGPFLALAKPQGPDPVAEGLYLSVTCPEGTRRIRPGEIAANTRGVSFGVYRIDQQIAACRLWPTAQADPRLRAPLRSRAPVLLLAGGRDGTATVAWARQVAAGLPRSRVVVIGPMTHLPIGLDNMVCLDRMMDAFFQLGSAEGLDTSCVASMQPPPFVLPAKTP